MKIQTYRSMIYRSKAPLRLGLAGGGTDVSPFSDEYGGAILNATISLAAHASIEPLTEKEIIIESLDQKQQQHFKWTNELPIRWKTRSAQRGLQPNSKRLSFPETGFRLSTFVDAPAGSGLGTSSTLVVAIIGAFMEMLKLAPG